MNSTLFEVQLCQLYYANLDPIATYVVPISIPDLDEVRKAAYELQAKGKMWQGEIFGWGASIKPEKTIASTGFKNDVYSSRLLHWRKWHLFFFHDVGGGS